MNRENAFAVAGLVARLEEAEALTAKHTFLRNAVIRACNILADEQNAATEAEELLRVALEASR